MSKINSDDSEGYFAAGGKFVRDLVIESYGNIINQEGERGFSDGINIGIKNTIASLYDAKVDDDEIIRVVNKFWGINREEAENRLIFEKAQTIIRELKHFLKMKGNTPEEIDQFMISGGAAKKIRHYNELWELSDKPEKLIKRIKELK